MSVTRRKLLKSVPVAAAAASAWRSTPLRAANPHRVVVVGGGFGGATAAKYLSLWGGSDVQVTLVDASTRHVSCIMSNLVLNRQLGFPDLTFDLDALARSRGLVFREARVEAIDAANRSIALADGDTLAYDSLVLSTGIAFDAPGGRWNPGLTPHAWIAGPQTALLRRQLEAMPDSGTVILTIPPAPFRCPPGPYERACTMAELLARRGGTPKVLVLDANPGIQAEAETFRRAFRDVYGSIIEYRSGVALFAVDSQARTVETSLGTFTGDVLNVIPPHRATDLLVDSGLTGGGAWAPVDPVTYASTLPGFEAIHVIGDSQGTGQPKSGHMANAQAKICSDAILRKAAGLSAYTEERLANITTNSACFSPITATEASWLTAVFAYDRTAGKMALVPGSLGEAGRWTRENYREMFTWSNNLFADTFR